MQQASDLDDWRPPAVSAAPAADRARVAAAWLGLDRSELDGVSTAVLEGILDRRGELMAARRQLASQGRSIALLRARTEALRRESRVDVLTGLLNRRGIEERLAWELDRRARSGDDVAIVVLDVVGLKRVNDSLGHAAGDDLLIAVASAVRSQLRSHDHVGRIGGDEFLAVLPRTDHGGATRMAERVVAAAGRLRVGAGDAGVAVALSAGWASTTDDDELDPGLLIARADRHLYALRGLRAPQWQEGEFDVRGRSISG